MSDRKYRQRGYQDDGRERGPRPALPSQKPEREPGAPAGARRISSEGAKNPRMMGYREVARCARCGLPQWVGATVEQTSFDMATARRPEGYQPPATRDAALAMFDANVGAARGALAGKTDAELMAPWSLLRGGQPVFTMPRAGVLRAFVMNHIVHHRGQLSVYLRMLGVPMPSIYGPSGDEAL